VSIKDGSPVTFVHNSTNGGVARNYSDVKAWLHCVAATPHNKVVAAGDASSVVTIWDGSNGQVLHCFSNK